MSYFGSIVNDATRAYCAVNHLPEPPTYGDAHYCQPEDETVEDTALQWLWRCRKSEEAAAEVVSDIELAAYGNFVALAAHLVSDVGPYTDCRKVVNALVDSLEGTLKERAKAKHG